MPGEAFEDEEAAFEAELDVERQMEAEQGGAPPPPPPPAEDDGAGVGLGLAADLAAASATPAVVAEEDDDDGDGAPEFQDGQPLPWEPPAPAPAAAAPDAPAPDAGDDLQMPPLAAQPAAAAVADQPNNVDLSAKFDCMICGVADLPCHRAQVRVHRSYAYDRQQRRDRGIADDDPGPLLDGPCPCNIDVCGSCLFQNIMAADASCIYCHKPIAVVQHVGTGALHQVLNPTLGIDVGQLFEDQRAPPPQLPPYVSGETVCGHPRCNTEHRKEAILKCGGFHDTSGRHHNCTHTKFRCFAHARCHWPPTAESPWRCATCGQRNAFWQIRQDGEALLAQIRARGDTGTPEEYARLCRLLQEDNIPDDLRQAHPEHAQAAAAARAPAMELDLSDEEWELGEIGDEGAADGAAPMQQEGEALAPQHQAQAEPEYGPQPRRVAGGGAFVPRTTEELRQVVNDPNGPDPADIAALRAAAAHNVKAAREWHTARHPFLTGQHEAAKARERLAEAANRAANAAYRACIGPPPEKERLRVVWKGRDATPGVPAVEGTIKAFARCKAEATRLWNEDQANSKAIKDARDVKTELLAKLLAVEAAYQEQRDRANASGFGGRLQQQVRASLQALEGMTRWPRCGELHVIQLLTPKLAEFRLDVHHPTRVMNVRRALYPPPGGLVAVTSGTGGGKTVQMMKFLLARVHPEVHRKHWPHDPPDKVRYNYELPLVFVTARICLAEKLVLELRAKGVTNMRSYRATVDEGRGLDSMEKWLDHPWIIVSMEQVHIAEPNLATYLGCVLVMDEVMTAASSLVNGVTVRTPFATARTLKKLAANASHVLMMDADFDADEKCKVFAQGIMGPERPVLHVQTMDRSLNIVLVIYWGNNKAHRKLFKDQMELSVRESVEARRAGTPNRTYISLDTPDQVGKMVRKVHNKWRAEVRGLHGKLGEIPKANAMRDLDAYMAPADVMVANSVIGIGMDTGLKFRTAFVEAKGGRTNPNMRSLFQRLARLGRRTEDTPANPATGQPFVAATPLDPFTHPGTEADPRNKLYPDGAIHLMLPGLPPDESIAPRRRPAQSAARAHRRVQAKGYAMRGDIGIRVAHATQRFGAAREAEARMAAVQHADATGQLTPALPRTDTLADETDDLAMMLQKLEAISLAEEDDCSTDNQILKFLELNATPSRRFLLETVARMTDAQMQRLRELRQSQPPPIPKDQEEKLDLARAIAAGGNDYDIFLGWLGRDGRLAVAKAYVEHRDNWEGFKLDCFGWCQPQKPREPGSNLMEIVMDVWSVCRPYLTDDKKLPDKGLYKLLLEDRNSHNIQHRAQMLHVPPEHLWTNEVQGWLRGVLSDPRIGPPRAAAKAELLAELAHVLELEGGLKELLTPQTWVLASCAWLQAHNTLVESRDESGEAGDMVRAARLIAVKLGCKRIIHGEKAKYKTTLARVVAKILREVCAVEPPPEKKVLGKLEFSLTMGEFKTKVFAPNLAERCQYFSVEMNKYVKLSEYEETWAQWKLEAAEYERTQTQRARNGRVDALMHRENEGLAAQFPDLVGTPLVAPAPQRFRVYEDNHHNLNVRFVAYSGPAIATCLKELGKPTMEPTRRIAADALWRVITSERDPPLGAGQLKYLRRLFAEIEWLRAYHNLTVILNRALPAPDAHGIRYAREVYHRPLCTIDGVPEPRVAECERATPYVDASGTVWHTTANDMQAELRNLLLARVPDPRDLSGQTTTDRYLHVRAWEPELTICTLIAYRLGGPEAPFKPTYLIEHYLADPAARDEWHKTVGKFHGVLGKTDDWPGMLLRGAKLSDCLTHSSAPPQDGTMTCEAFKEMQKCLYQLPIDLINAGRAEGAVDAMWTGSAMAITALVDELDSRGLRGGERNGSVVSKLVAIVQDTIVAEHAKAVRAVSRNYRTPVAYDRMPKEVRDSGAQLADGLLIDVTHHRSPEQMFNSSTMKLQENLEEEGWDASAWGVVYKVDAVLANYPEGTERDDPLEDRLLALQGVERGNAAMAAAYSNIPEVKRALDAYEQRRAPPAAQAPLHYYDDDDGLAEVDEFGDPTPAQQAQDAEDGFENEEPAMSDDDGEEGGGGMQVDAGAAPAAPAAPPPQIPPPDYVSGEEGEEGEEGEGGFEDDVTDEDEEEEEDDSGEEEADEEDAEFVSGDEEEEESDEEFEGESEGDESDEEDEEDEED